VPRPSLTRLLASLALAALALAGRPTSARAETGYDLWLRYRPLADGPQRTAYRATLTGILVESKTATGVIIANELTRGLGGLFGTAVPRVASLDADHRLLVGTPDTSPAVAALGWADRLRALGPEGYLIRTARAGSRRVTVIASSGEAGALYGSFHLLRLLQTGMPIGKLEIAGRPRLARRLLNHWDNLDGSIERGYAGRSLWDWEALPGRVDPRIDDYARANASIGINGTAINSVNANPRSLTTPYILKAKAIADRLRPYGIRVYLSANFATPRVLKELATTDPLDPEVARWWKVKAAEIYKHIPDFGGFVVKANSEGQPGPQDYKRTHADGANVLADALAPHGGIVMWRAFVYDAGVDPDRVKRAYLEFVPLDGRFRDNVLVQVKTGPLDFQPREPFHPLFGALPKTPILGELQITQEYMGHSTHLVYLAPMWKEVLDADTFANGPGSTVAEVLDGSVHGYRLTGVAGVANTGSDANWCGHDFAQANWYAYGRLAWNPDLGARSIAEEWARMTWSRDPAVVRAILDVMLPSHEAIVNYSMPLGLHHLIGGDHYAPMPENPDPRREDWSAIYYHRASNQGVGFDRTATGSRAVEQYRSPLREQWGNLDTVPESLLLWFHRVGWDHRLRSGQTLWEGLVTHYTRGVEAARAMLARWERLDGRIDAERHAAVLAKLRTQVAHAEAWRDKCLKYFQTFSRRPIPATNP
jgi:alpha-glucuronidase